MADQDFQDRVFETLSGIESRLEKRLDAIESQQKKDNDRLEKRLDAMEAQRREDNDRLEKRLNATNDRLEKRLDAMETHVAQMRQDVGWVKGKLEGKQEGSGRMLTVFTTGAAIAAVVIALIALFSG